MMPDLSPFRLNTKCAVCLRHEKTIAQMDKKIMSLKSKLNQSPIQLLANLRAEFQEVRDELRSHRDMLAAIKGEKK